MGLRSRLKRLEREASEDLESFELLDGSRYYYDPLETYKEQFLHALDVLLGDADKWDEPPEIYRKICEAKDPAAVIEQLESENPQVSLVNVAELFDAEALVHERRLAPISYLPPEDLSE